MPVQGIFGTSIELLGKTLDLRAKRQTMIAANLANVETPGYTPTDLSFEGQLKSALKDGGRSSGVTNPRHIPLKGRAGALPGVQGDVIEIGSGSMAPDGNGVEMESEMGRLAENQIMYNASVQILGKEFEELKQAIRGTL